MNDQHAMTNDNTCLACTLHGREFAERKEAISRDLFTHAIEVKELADGYAYRFAGFDPWAERVLAFIAVERECCPFFTFELVVEPNEGAIWLQLRGSAEIKEFVTVELDGIAPSLTNS